MPLIQFYVDNETFINFKQNLSEEEKKNIKEDIRKRFKRLVKFKCVKV